MTGTDKALASRFEIKYLVREADVPAMRRFIAPFMRPDEYAASRPGYEYAISSLYLDTPDRLCYRMTTGGIKNRFKLRLRTYSDDLRTPVFFEIKRRMNRVILKRRAPISRDQALAICAGRPDAGTVRALEPLANLHEFRGLSAVAEARPAFRVRYDREAYESRTGEPLRVTFDRNVAYNPTSRYELSLGGAGWRAAPIPGVVLEVKFTDCFPTWITAMIRLFELETFSIAKYVISVDAARSEPPYAAAPPWPGARAPWIP